MTSTPFNVGLTDNTRLSSRVLRPPGGGHTDIFGSEPEPLRNRRRQVPGSQVSQIGPEKPTNGTESHDQNGQATSEAPPQPEPPATTKNAENGNVENTGKDENPAKTEAPVVAQQLAAEPPKRVRVPPGGFSSGLW